MTGPHVTVDGIELGGYERGLVGRALQAAVEADTDDMMNDDGPLARFSNAERTWLRYIGLRLADERPRVLTLPGPMVPTDEDGRTVTDDGLRVWRTDA